MTRTLLIIDDDPLFRIIARRQINHLFPEMEIMEFEHGKAACEFLKSNRLETNKAKVFLDINMPVMNGWEFLDACRAQVKKPVMDIYIITSSVDESDKLKAKSYSMVKDYIEKPLSKEFIQSLNTERDGPPLPILGA